MELIVFVPACLLFPAFQAKYDITTQAEWNKEFLNFFAKNNINTYQMPCPEASFHGYNQGLSRSCHGISYYEKLEGFNKYCDRLSEKMSLTIKELAHIKNFEFVIMGIEHSPTCAASYMYTRQGTQKRQGLFVEKLTQKLEDCEKTITTIGINRRYPGKAIRQLEYLYANVDK